MARRNEHSQEELKELILNAAETIVVEQGFAELKVRKIAMEIGYTVGSIYMVFDNMADLALHLKARAVDDLTSQLNKIQDIGNKKQRLLALAHAYVAFAEHNTNRWSMIFCQSRQQKKQLQLPAWYQEKITHLFTMIETIFRALDSARSAQDCRSAALAFWSAIHGICFVTISGQLQPFDDNDSKAMASIMVKNFVDGWLTGNQ